MHVRTRTLGALSLYFASTVAFAIVAHAIVEALATGGLQALTTPIHAALGGLALVSFVLLGTQLGLGRSAHERRRRSALFLASLPRSGRGIGMTAASIGAQTLIAVGALALEGIPADPTRLALAIACGIAALCFGTLVSHSLRSSVTRLLAAIRAALVPPPAIPHAMRRLWALVPAMPGLYELFLPNRPPPRLSSIPTFFS